MTTQAEARQTEQTDRAGVPYIDAAMVRRLTPMPALIDAIGAAFRGDTVAPARHAHELSGDSSLLLMPAWRKDEQIGVKLTMVNRAAAASVSATYLLLDAKTGHLRAIFDGNMLTGRRTAAASALAADHLARSDARTLLVIGTGTLAPHLIEAHAAVRKLDRIFVWGRDAAKARAVVDVARAAGFPADVADDRDAALAQSDIVSSATLSTAPLVHGAMLRPGMHIDLVGAFRPEMCEADPETFARSRVFVDTRDGAMDEAGDLLQAIRAGAAGPDDIAGDLHELCRGQVEGRNGNPDIITLFKSVGTGLEDLAAAELILATQSSAVE